jgi:HK97 family phage portal protein
MGILSRVAAWLQRSNEPEWFREWALQNKSATGINISQWRAMQASTVMACVAIRSIDVAKLPKHVYRAKRNGGQAVVKDHPLELLLRKPNAWQTGLEFFEQMQAAFLLLGNAYAAIARNGRGEPLALIPVNPTRVQLYESTDGSLFYAVSRTNGHENAVLSGFPQVIPAADILHLRWISFNGLLGLSRISLARDAIGLSLAQEQLAAMLFDNGANLGGYLHTDKTLKPDTLARLKVQWNANYSGLNNAGKTAVLEEGLKHARAGMTAVEADMDKQRRFQVEEIARDFDVPAHRLGIMPEGGGQAILQAQQAYINNTVTSDVERWEAKLNDAFGLDGEKQFVEFDVDAFNRADIQARYTAYRTGIVGTFLTPNDARRMEGLPKDENGDVLLQPMNVAPLGAVPLKPSAGGPGSDTTGAPAPGGDGDPAAVPEDSIPGG